MSHTRRLAAYLVSVNRTYLSKPEKGAGDQKPVIIAQPVLEVASWGLPVFSGARQAIRNRLLGRQRLHLR